MNMLGLKIKYRREELGMTQAELAAKLGYKNKTTITKIENGTNDIPQNKVAKFATALKTTTAYLMGWVEIGVDQNGYLVVSDAQKIEIGARISMCRKEYDLTIAQLSDRSGISQQEIQEIESAAARQISFQTIIALAHSMYSNVEFLLGLDYNTISFDLTELEACVIERYRENPEKRHAIHVYLDIWDNSSSQEINPDDTLKRIELWNRYHALNPREKNLVDLILKKDEAAEVTSPTSQNVAQS